MADAQEGPPDAQEGPPDAQEGPPDAQEVFLDAALRRARHVVIATDRSALVPALEETEEYAAGASEFFLSGRSAERALKGTSGPAGDDPDSYQLEFHAPMPNRHARALADRVQKRVLRGLTAEQKKTPPFEKIVRVRTVIFDQLLELSLGSRRIARISLLPRAAGTRTANVIQPAKVPARWARGRTLRSFGPELVLVGIYSALCDPSRTGDWADLAFDERILRARLLKEAWRQNKRGGAGGSSEICPGICRGNYRESGTFTHDGREYSLGRLLHDSQKLPVVEVPTSELAWVVTESRSSPDPARVARADLSAPVLVARTDESPSRLVALDGFHRIAAAIAEGRDALPAREISGDLLRAAARPSAPGAKIEGGSLPSGVPADPDERAAWGSIGGADLAAIAGAAAEATVGGASAEYQIVGATSAGASAEDLIVGTAVAGVPAENLIVGGRRRRPNRISSRSQARAPAVAPVVASRLLKLALESYAGPGRILVGEAAVDWKAAPRRLAFVADGTLGEEEEALRRALAPGLSPQYTLEGRVHDAHLPVDPRLRRLTISAVSAETGLRRPLVDVYNISQYSLCPFFEAHHSGADRILRIGTLPLVMRVLTAEFWVVLLLRRAGKLNEGSASSALADTLEAVRVAGKKLDLRLLGKPGKRGSDPPERLPDYGMVFPSEGKWYAGRVVDEVIAAKKAALKAREIRRAGNYYPLKERPGR